MNASVISQYRQLAAYLWLHMSICHRICKFQINVRIECQIATVGTPDPNIEETHCCHYLQGRTWTRTRRKTYAFARQALLIRSSMWVMPPTILESSCESFGRASTFATPSMGGAGFLEGSFPSRLPAETHFFCHSRATNKRLAVRFWGMGT